VATQNALRVEMQKARTPSDVEGYIYAFEILGTTHILCLIPLIASNLRELVARRFYRQEDDTPEGRTRDKSQ
jgi:hypothetical protein